MTLQDSADALLGILWANPEKVDRRLLAKLKLSHSNFSFDPSSEQLFKIIALASYADKKVNPTFIEAYSARNKLPKDLVDDISFTLERVEDVEETNFSYVEEATKVFKEELKTWQFKKLLFSSNEALNKGDKSISDILLAARQTLQDITTEESDAKIESTRGYTSQFIEEYTKSVEENSLIFGIKPLDDSIGRILPGELVILAAASGEGKSFTSMNILYNNLMNHKNLVLASLEMGKQQVLYRLLSLHSTNPKFGYNIPHDSIRKKTLSEADQDHLFEVAQDLFENTDYGELFFSEGATTVDAIFDEAEDINKFVHLDGIFIDYISLLDGKGSSDQSKIANNFKAIKQRALSFDHNHRIPVFSVHQISEQAKEKAEESGRYDFNFLSDTSEARKSSDSLLWLLRTKAMVESHEALIGVSKVRDSEIPHSFSLFEDFAHSKLTAIDAEIE